MDKKILFTYLGLGFLLLGIVDVTRAGRFTQLNLGYIVLSVFLLLSAKILKRR